MDDPWFDRFMRLTPELKLIQLRDLRLTESARLNVFNKEEEITVRRAAVAGMHDEAFLEDLMKNDPAFGKVAEVRLKELREIGDFLLGTR